MIQTKFGNEVVELNISRSDLTDFVSNPANEVLCKILNDRVQNLFVELRSAIRDQDQNNVYAIESYIQALEHVTDLVGTDLEHALRESDQWQERSSPK
jgi:hypothetical protein